MENLLVLLAKIQQLSPLPVFSAEVIIVQNPGMQHWLNLSLAQRRGISMNIDYAMPSQFLWQLIRTLAGEEKVPEQALFSREVLTWKIYQLLAADEVVNNSDFAGASRYWLGQEPHHNSSQDELKNDSDSQLKRYQLACQLADLYEQYLIFRPQWIDAWQQGNFDQVVEFGSEQASMPKNGEQVQQHLLWQGKLWQLLTQDLAYNPITFVRQAIANLATKKALLPQRISFFGINAMAPLWLEFINALSKYTQVHFFHLNPCYAYWGDVLTEKQAIKSIDQWLVGVDSKQAEPKSVDLDVAESEDIEKITSQVTDLVGNPLLANLGQQGREFMALLHQYSTINIDAFEAITAEVTDDVEGSVVDGQQAGGADNLSVLHHVQHDILSLTDVRAATRAEANRKQDQSITITSCHSALREVQGFHDWLLAQFNQDGELTPKDVLVMCPQVEHYAPYVNAVFSQGWQELADNLPPLPCSIADRVTKDAEPLVAAFLQLLTLPDSRFQVSQLLAYLRLPAMQEKFGLTLAELDTISVWLERACVHWGLDVDHKAQVLAQEYLANPLNQDSQANQAYSGRFTWQEGLTRLLRGFAFGDQQVIYQQQLLLPDVEGNNAILLGKLMLIIEQLGLFASQLTTARTAEKWQVLLQQLLESLFATEEEPVFETIYQAIAKLTEYCQLAGYQGDLDLAIVQDFLNNHFSSPEPGRHFLVGQVTFCSMLPMRSIPFKIIAILGLNDGEFPRQRQAMGFDLMANTPAKLGDRSRRGDDRYMFLEALISARQALYLSYQGRSIRNDNEKQPSLVLKELMDYLTFGYGWQCDVNQADCDIRQLPMQPFSVKNYLPVDANNSAPVFNSFDPKWLALATTAVSTATASQQLAPVIINKVESERSEPLKATAEQLIRFFQHPAKAFAHSALGLYFEDNRPQLDDVEPFDFNALDSYLFREQLLDAFLEANSQQSNSLENNGVENDRLANELDQVKQQALLSGKFPEFPHTEQVLAGWQQGSELFTDYIKSQALEHTCTLAVTLPCSHPALAEPISISVDFPLHLVGESGDGTSGAGVNKLTFYRSSTAKGKDYFTLYLQQLLMQCWQQQVQQQPQLLADAQIKQGEVDLAQLTALASQAVESHGYYFDTKQQKISHSFYGQIDSPQQKLAELLACYLQGQQQPLLVNLDLAEKSLSGRFNSSGKGKGKPKAFEQSHFEQFWSNNTGFSAFGEDPYIHYFWPSCPHFADIEPNLLALYQDYLQARQQVKVS